MLTDLNINNVSYQQLLNADSRENKLANQSQNKSNDTINYKRLLTVNLRNGGNSLTIYCVNNIKKCYDSNRPT